MAKKVRAIIKLQIQAGKATPAPPVGPALGQHGVNIMAFCKDYNEQTKNQAGSIIPVEITVYEDRSFIFVTKTPPASDLLKKALNIEKGSGTAGQEVAGTLTRDKILEILAEIFHIRPEMRKKVLHELVDYGYIDIVSSNEYRIVGA